MAQLEKHQYLLNIEYLGFRYSGWQRQPGQKTVEGMLLKTIHFVLPGRQVKLLGAGRTDAMVSAEGYGLQLLLQGPTLGSRETFLADMNQNLPPDIRLTSVTSVSPGFNAIRDCTLKTYRYYFSFGDKPHPFCAPYLGYFPGDLDLESMEKGAECFQGTHDFRAFIVKPAPKAKTVRTVEHCHLKLNSELTASFFPPLTYFVEVAGPGFGRNQVRMMMTALVQIGRGQLELEAVVASLREGSPLGLAEIAPASGLQLIRTVF